MRDRMVLFCYAEGTDDAWEAICLDFDISVQGTSVQDVMSKLDVAIKEYFEYVRTLPEEEQKRFLTRHVPWYVQLNLALKTLFAWLCHRRDTKGRHSYSVPCTV
jgi:hypothetical protein